MCSELKYTERSRVAGRTMRCEHCGLSIQEAVWYTIIVNLVELDEKGRPRKYAVHDNAHCREGLLVRLGYAEPTFASSVNPEKMLDTKLASLC